jgi:Ca2+-binding RTX toxin-like protein
MSVPKISQRLAGSLLSDRHSSHDFHVVDVLGLGSVDWESPFLTVAEMPVARWDAPLPIGLQTPTSSGVSDGAEASTTLTPSALKLPPGGGGGGGGGGATAGDDTLVGTSANDSISGLGGNDTISGLGGNDTLSGGDGNDSISGGTGMDSIDGGAGDDIIYSDAGPVSGSSAPPLDRGSEADTITGGDGSDIIYAGYGDNVDGGADGLYGDTLNISFQGALAGVHFDAHLTTQTIGGATITGIENYAYIEGSNYGDYIDASGAPNSYSCTQIFGMAGDDTLIANAVTTILDGGDGNDFLDGRNSQNLDELNGGAGNDVIYGPTEGPAPTIDGGDGNDTITANGLIHGGAGDDVIQLASPFWGNDASGDAGNDTIYGSDGDDTLRGGAGDNILTGGAGNDLFVVGKGNDTITDFSPGDRLAFENSFSASAINQVGSDVVITFDNQYTLTFKNADVAGVKAAIQSAIHLNDVAISADGSTIYGAGDDGTLYVYSGETGELMRAVHLGNDLGAIDISPDGSFAMITDWQPLTASYGPNGDWPDNQFTIAVYKLDLVTGEVTTFPLTITGQTQADFYDVAVLSDGTVLLSEAGGGQDYLLDPNTGTFTHLDIQGGTAILSATDDGKYALLGEPYSDGALNLYQSGQGVVAAHSLYEDGQSGFNRGVQAISENGSLIAQSVYGEGLNIYDAQLHLIVNLTQSHPEWLYGTVSGLAFDPSGQYLFVLDNQSDTIVKLSTSDWSIVAEYAVGADISGYNGLGDSLLLSPDMTYFTVLTQDGTLIRVDAGSSPQPTEGDDTLIGTSAADTIDGLGGNDTIKGLAGDDNLHGSSGDDLIAGGAGADTLDGGDGNDRIYTGDSLLRDTGSDHDVVTAGPGDDFISAGYGDSVDGGDGKDTLDLSFAGANAGVSFDTANLSAGATIGGGTIQNIEALSHLQGSAFGDTLTVGLSSLTIDADAGNDMVVATGSNLIINGGDGDDSITSSGGAATINGGDGSDTINVSSWGNYIFGGAGDDFITFNGSSTMIYGGDGNDRIVVDASGISASGGSGDDTFASQGGGNWLHGDDGSDTIDYSSESGPVGVDLSSGAGAGGDHLDSIENAIGSAFADTLTGSAGANALNGGAGNDTISGGKGADTLTGGSGSDIFLYALGDGADIVTDFASGDSVTISGYGSAQSVTQSGNNVVVIFAGGEQITFQNTTVSIVQSGLHFDAPPGQTLTGTSGNDSLVGSSGNDTLSGLAGNDMLDGRAGADHMAGGSGNDIYYVDNSGDVVTELSGAGTDTVHSTIDYVLPNNVERGILDGTANINLTGNGLANILSGNGGDNFLYGMAGNDKLVGGAGNDILRGGLGTDTLTGGTGADIFQFEANNGNDKVTDFVSGTDKLDFHLLGISSSDIKTVVSNGNLLVKVDANHDGLVDFTITLAGVTHISASDYILH